MSFVENLLCHATNLQDDDKGSGNDIYHGHSSQLNKTELQTALPLGPITAGTCSDPP